ncbi:MAG: hypothetical protein AAGG80_03770, partial [Pseudomonadota bacterium]
MLIKPFAAYVMRGRWEAYSLAFIFSLMPFLGWLGIAIAALVTLRKGAKEGLMIFLVTAIPAIIYLLLGRTLPLYSSVFGGALIVYILALTLRRTGSWPIVIQTATLIAIIAVFCAHLFIPKLIEYWTITISNYFNEAESLTNLSLPANDIQTLTYYLARFATGIIAMWFMWVNLINLCIARWFQAELYNPKGLGPELLNIRLGWLANILLIVIAAATLLKLTPSWDYIPIIIGMFFAAGLSLVHAWISQSKFMIFLYILFYGLLVLEARFIIPLT